MLANAPISDPIATAAAIALLIALVAGALIIGDRLRGPGGSE